MRRLAPLLCALLLTGCGCSESEPRGHPDSSTDPGPDAHDPLVEDGPCGPCDDSDPCTVDLCNTETLECVFLPLDSDLDGFTPEECDGMDCDDTRADVHPGAPEVCLDGVDQDCDGLVDGPIVMGDEVNVAAPDGRTQSPSIVWTGSEYAIAWAHRPHEGVGEDLGVSRLDPTGERIGEDILVRRVSEGDNTNPSLAWTGRSLALSWNLGDAVAFASLSATGEIEVPTTRLGVTGHPELAWTGTGFGLVWAEPSWAPTPRLLFLTLNPAGEITSDPSGAPQVVTEFMSSWNEGLDIAWTGSEFALVWSDWDGSYLDVYFGRMTGSGDAASEPLRFTDTGAWSDPRMVWTGSELGLTYYVHIPSVYLSRATPTGELVGRDTRVTDFSMHAYRPDIAWTGSEFGVAYMAGPEGEQSSMFSLVGPTGEVRTDPLPVNEDTAMRESTRITWSGSEFGLTWVDTSCDGFTYPCEADVMFTRIGLCD